MLTDYKQFQFRHRNKCVKTQTSDLTYEGTIAGAHETQSNKGKCRGEAKLVGTGAYDVKAQRLLSLVWVFVGTFRGPPPSDKVALPYTGVVEWRSERVKRKSPQDNDNLRDFSIAR
jgi:hypothetical protein